jgi:hypothetical protein
MMRLSIFFCENHQKNAVTPAGRARPAFGEIVGAALFVASRIKRRPDGLFSPGPFEPIFPR